MTADPQRLAEWAFRFAVDTREPVAASRLDDLLATAIQWAEPRSLGIGGGFRARSGTQACSLWDFDFGLCVTLDDRLIPYAQARELLDVLQRWCAERGFGFSGGLREYGAEEL